MKTALIVVRVLLMSIAGAVLILAPRRDIVMRSLFFGPIFLLALGYATGTVAAYAVGVGLRAMAGQG